MLQPIRLTCVLALSVVALAAQTVPAPSFIVTSGMVGLAQGQTARLNLLNGVQPPAVGTICTAAVTYLDGDGTVLKTASVTVTPGKSQAVDLHDTDIALTAGERREIRTVISVPAIPPPSTSGSTATTTATPACKLMPTLEIFDSLTGRTEAIVGHVETVE
jgi:hypothetical protein